MASFARDIMSYKYYMEGAHAEDQAQIEGTLRSEKVKNPTRIPLVSFVFSEFSVAPILSFKWEY